MLADELARIPLPDGALLVGDLVVPVGARGVVVFAHGSGSSRHSSRNRAVAAGLHERGLGTLLVDLLTADEERVDAATRALRFDIGLLARRLEQAAEWVSHHPATEQLALGYFGASTGAAAALLAAARRPGSVRAVVSRGGRPDLAGDHLAAVRAPTLLIVGGRDEQVAELNRAAYARLGAEADLVVVPGASHLFPEPGALAEVTRLAGAWFARHLAPAAPASREEP